MNNRIGLKPVAVEPDGDFPFRGMTDADYHLGVAEAHKHAAETVLAAAVHEGLADLRQAPSTKNLISRSRTSLGNMIKAAMDLRSSLHRDIATAKAAHDAAVAKAKADLDATTEDIGADLFQVSETLNALQQAHDQLAQTEA